MFNEMRYSEKKNINPRRANTNALGDLLFFSILVVIGLSKMVIAVLSWLIWRTVVSYSFSVFQILTSA